MSFATYDPATCYRCGGRWRVLAAIVQVRLPNCAGPLDYSLGACCRSYIKELPNAVESVKP